MKKILEKREIVSIASIVGGILGIISIALSILPWIGVGEVSLSGINLINTTLFGVMPLLVLSGSVIAITLGAITYVDVDSKILRIVLLIGGILMIVGGTIATVSEPENMSEIEESFNQTDNNADNNVTPPSQEESNFNTPIGIYLSLGAGGLILIMNLLLFTIWKEEGIEEITKSETTREESVSKTQTTTTQSKQKETSDKVKVKVKKGFKHKGKRYEEGKVIKVPRSFAKKGYREGVLEVKQ
ncbi:MAG: hypothetical protein ACOCRX_04665 [Candidatus Woesearchaeota archaeon]